MDATLSNSEIPVFKQKLVLFKADFFHASLSLLLNLRTSLRSSSISKCTNDQDTTSVKSYGVTDVLLEFLCNMSSLCCWILSTCLQNDNKKQSSCFNKINIFIIYMACTAPRALSLYALSRAGPEKALRLC